MITRRASLALFAASGAAALAPLPAAATALAAAAATLPNVVLRPLGVCVITLFFATQSPASTPHSFAAASMSISRAAAPPSRTY